MILMVHTKPCRQLSHRHIKQPTYEQYHVTRAHTCAVTLAPADLRHLLPLALLAELLSQLSVNQPPSIKQYQEAIVAHLALQHPSLLQELLLPQITSVEKGGAATGSHILIAVQVALHSPAEQQHELLPQLLKLLLPWTNHHTHHIRTFAQLGFCALLVRMCFRLYATCALRLP
jgi:hypothetical protein